MTTAFNEPKYQLANPEFRCSRCVAEIPCEEPYYAGVVYGEDSFQRQSFCATCWPAEAKDFFAFWRSRRPPLPADRPKRVRFETPVVLEFFRRLGPGEAKAGGGGPAAAPDGSPSLEERAELRFVLALLLVRKKVLNFGSSCQKDGAEWLKLVEKAAPAAAPSPLGPPRGTELSPLDPPKGTPEDPAGLPAGMQRVHWVRNPELSDAQLERVKVRIGELLQMQLA